MILFTEKMKSLHFQVVILLYFTKTCFAGIEIPRETCEWFNGTSYGVNVKCDGNIF